MLAEPLPRRLAAEALGTALLLATVVGSGIMAERLAGDNQALALLCNAIATGAILVVIITIFARQSRAPTSIRLSASSFRFAASSPAATSPATLPLRALAVSPARSSPT